MDRDELLAQIKKRLEDAFGSRFHGLVLYGSEARGEAGPDSDIDLMVLLEGPLRVWNDIRTAVDATYDLQLQQDRTFDLQPVDRTQYERGTFAYYRAAKQDGIVV